MQSVRCPMHELSSKLTGCCRLDSVQVVLQGGLEDPLDKEEELQDQMDSLPYMCRFQYEKTCAYICGLLDPCIEAFTTCAPLLPLLFSVNVDRAVGYVRYDRAA